MNDEQLTIREVLGDAPEEARRAEQAEGERRATMDSNQDPGGYQGDRMDDQTIDRPNESVTRTRIDESSESGVESHGALSTADIASASSPATTEERRDVARAERTPEAPRPAEARGVPGREEPADSKAPLFPANEADELRKRWVDLQAGFVDEPRQAVEHADSLVADVIQRLASSFADERAKLERQWGSGGDVSTEDLRVALRRYRSFFDRLLSM